MSVRLRSLRGARVVQGSRPTREPLRGDGDHPDRRPAERRHGRTRCRDHPPGQSADTALGRSDLPRTDREFARTRAAGTWRRTAVAAGLCLHPPPPRSAPPRRVQLLSGPRKKSCRPCPRLQGLRPRRRRGRRSQLLRRRRGGQHVSRVATPRIGPLMSRRRRGPVHSSRPRQRDLSRRAPSQLPTTTAHIPADDREGADRQEREPPAHVLRARRAPKQSRPRARRARPNLHAPRSATSRWGARQWTLSVRITHASAVVLPRTEILALGSAWS